MTIHDRNPEWNWLDSVISIDAQEQELVGDRTFWPDEWYFAFHFPGAPIVPGVLLIEAMAHAGGALQALRMYRAERVWSHYVLAGVESARFYRYVRPRDRVKLSARVVGGDADNVIAQTTARLEDGAKVARCGLLLRRIDAEGLVGGADTLLIRHIRRILPAELQLRYEIPIVD